MYELHRGKNSSHQILARQVLATRKSPVLDVGAGEGYLGQMLVDSGLILDAVEPDEARAAVARQFYRTVYCCRAEDVGSGNPYSVIVFGDVLEHIERPERVLGLLLHRLAPGGVVLVSLPNIAHVAVRLALLAGRFPPMDRGILDRTHLHFFTRKSAEEMLESEGLEITGCWPTAVPAGDVVRGRLRKAVAAVGALQSMAIRFRPTLFAYQWVFAATPARLAGDVEPINEVPQSCPDILASQDRSLADVATQSIMQP